MPSRRVRVCFLCLQARTLVPWRSKCFLARPLPQSWCWRREPRPAPPARLLLLGFVSSPAPRPRSLQAEGGSPEPAFPQHGAAGPPAHLHSCVPPPRVPPKLGLSCVTQNPASENLDSSMEQNAMYPTRAAGVPGCGHGCPATHPNSPKERIPPRC